MNLGFWLPLVVGLLGGGAMGAVIKILYDRRQAGIQGILRRVKIFPLFDKTKAPGFDAVLTVKHETEEIKYTNIFVADVTVTNSGRSDFAEFEFGIENPGAECIHAAWENPDQHHILSLLEPVSPVQPRPGVKLRAQPFNRKDSYSLRLYLTSGQKRPDEPRLTSPHSIRFVEEPVPARSHSLLVGTIATLLTVAAFSLAMEVIEIRRDAKRYIEAQYSKTVQNGESWLYDSRNPPMPTDFAHVWPGMKLSEIRSALPGGELSSHDYALPINSGPFSGVTFSFSSSEDPTIDAVRFHYRDERAKEAVLRSVLIRFGHAYFKKEGTRFVWPGINEFELTVGSSYIVRRRPETR